MRRFIAGWAVLAFLVVNSHLPVAHAFAAASVSGDGASANIETPAPEHAASSCKNHQAGFDDSAGHMGGDDSPSGMACKVACIAIADVNVPIPLFLRERLAASAFVLVKLLSWRSIDHQPPVRPPFIG